MDNDEPQQRNCQRFTDDLALLANSINEAKNQLKVLQSQKIGLHISFENAEVMVEDPSVINQVAVTSEHQKNQNNNINNQNTKEKYSTRLEVEMHNPRKYRTNKLI